MNKNIIYDINELLYDLNKNNKLEKEVLLNIKNMLTEISEKGGIFYIYTDGSCINNQLKDNKKGGCGIYIIDLEGKEIKLKYNDINEENISNNKYEIYASLKAFQYVLNNYNLKDTKIYWICDSTYTINCLTKWFTQWKKSDFKTKKGEPVKNEVLIKLAKEQMTKLELNNNKIVCKHVPSHSKTESRWNKGNEIADVLAKEAAES